MTPEMPSLSCRGRRLKNRCDLCRFKGQQKQLGNSAKSLDPFPHANVGPIIGDTQFYRTGPMPSLAGLHYEQYKI
jgi:hypothetical protein